MMMLRKFAAALIVSGLLCAPTLAQQKAPGKSPDDIAASVPVEVPEVISGGGWQDGGKAGIYRGIVVMELVGGQPVANLVVQWIGLKAEGGQPEIVRAVRVKDFADRKMANAQLALEADTDNEAIFIATAFDPKTQKPSMVAFKALKPGQVAPTALPPGYTQGATKQ
jgi:hypothetical protein